MHVNVRYACECPLSRILTDRSGRVPPIAVRQYPAMKSRSPPPPPGRLNGAGAEAGRRHLRRQAAVFGSLSPSLL